MNHPFIALRPEDYAVFETLSTVKPIEVTWKDRKRDFLFDLHDAELGEFYVEDFSSVLDTDH